MEQEPVIKYNKGDLTVIWKPTVCTHSKKCWKGLGEVFKPLEKPWVNPEGASSERIMEQIDQCPSGALSYVRRSAE
ncbi:MAG: (4Fe-4S)-binding protein [Bacteroidia bacterium]